MREKIEGMEVIPVLAQRASRYCYVMGEVNTPGRFEMVGPTTVMQAMSMAGSWKVGANVRQIVIFRRGDDWRLLATMVNLDAALHGKQPCPAGRDLALGFRRDHRAEVGDPGGRRLHQPGVHPRASTGSSRSPGTSVSTVPVRWCCRGTGVRS